MKIIVGCLAIVQLALVGSAMAGSIELTEPERVGMSSAKLDVLRKYFQEQVDQGLEPGFQILIARRGRIVLHENVGYMNTETRQPISDDTLFRIMSMTKPVTGVTTSHVLSLSARCCAATPGLTQA